MSMRNVFRRLRARLCAQAAAAALAALAAGVVPASFAHGADQARDSRPPLEYRLDELIVTLSRGPCDGDCPVYNVAVWGSGEVIYYGEENVETGGEQIAQIRRDQVVSLLNSVYEAGFMDLRDSYLSGRMAAVNESGTVLVEYIGATGEQRSILTITIRGFSKRVVFQPQHAPKELVHLADLVDEVASSGRWTRGGR